jgi:hypothetical protein
MLRWGSVLLLVLVSACAPTVAGLQAFGSHPLGPGPQQSRPLVADIGSCYSVAPICIQGHPVCVCTLTMQCFWTCQ